MTIYQLCMDVKIITLQALELSELYCEANVRMRKLKTSTESPACQHTLMVHDHLSETELKVEDSKYSSKEVFMIFLQCLIKHGFLELAKDTIPKIFQNFIISSLSFCCRTVYRQLASKFILTSEVKQFRESFSKDFDKRRKEFWISQESLQPIYTCY